ncbi:glycoside hydrolase 5 family protein [Micromonospora psammae]|uniref:glycoside hydrolase 5 family protein n=1 Tax=Micromonospora sp. CPCC 205556 TaxID=3122398 RepID=UPI002FEFAA00
MTDRQAAGPRFGVNYVPSRNWWHCWLDWDTGSILADLRAVAGLGLDHIRVQLLWPVFQPDPSVVNRAALDRLGELLDLADRPDVGLDVSVTVLDGWLSGFVFAPAWLKGRNMITDDGVVTAELRLIDALAAAIGGHPRFLGFDLGNELAVINGDVAPNDGDRWAARMLAHCEQLAPGRLHVNGHDHQPWFEGRTFSPTGAATAGGASVFHTYPFWTGALERYGVDGTGTRHLGEYMAELAAAHASDPHRPRWLQEFGASPVERPADSIPDWTESLVRNTLSSADVWGCTWWGSHDIDRRLTGFHEYEYDLGLLSVDNDVKPTGERLRALVAQWRAAPPRPARRRTALVLDDPHRAGLEFADRFFTLIDEGIRPAIVTRDRATDADHLAARGIDQLVGC